MASPGFFDAKTQHIIMDILATGESRKMLADTNNAIGEAANVAAGMPDRTCKHIAGVLLMLQAAINGGGVGEWVEFAKGFGAKMQPKWEAAVTAQNN